MQGVVGVCEIFDALASALAKTAPKMKNSTNVKRHMCDTERSYSKCLIKLSFKLTLLHNFVSRALAFLKS